MTREQRELVLEVGGKLNDAGVEFVLAVGECGDGQVMSNVCGACAMKLLAGALEGAMKHVDREEHSTLQ